jgi:hypothetical protein
MHFEGTEALLPESVLGDIVAGGVKGFESLVQRLGLCGIGEQLHFYCKKHKDKYTPLLDIVKGTSWSIRLKAGVSASLLPQEADYEKAEC